MVETVKVNYVCRGCGVILDTKELKSSKAVKTALAEIKTLYYSELCYQCKLKVKGILVGMIQKYSPPEKLTTKETDEMKWLKKLEAKRLTKERKRELREEGYRREEKYRKKLIKRIVKNEKEEEIRKQKYQEKKDRKLQRIMEKYKIDYEMAKQIVSIRTSLSWAYYTDLNHAQKIVSEMMSEEGPQLTNMILDGFSEIRRKKLISVREGYQ